MFGLYPIICLVYTQYVGHRQLYPHDMGVSENSVPLNPMVLLIILPIKWLFVWEYTLFSVVVSFIIPNERNQRTDQATLASNSLMLSASKPWKQSGFSSRNWRVIFWWIPMKIAGVPINPINYSYICHKP